ncbi:hypothetical protein SAMN06295910_0634 [Allosphingosinicella indica]|uniref:Anti-sigma factor NepR domain-containing protein n=1 Tax=Allosphingosinicella indica TaxID=941907 RepID=A0A1X7FZW3_9SPHN|nr:NepR family anti-sigma factor [Allosphingosinicella indica]SMF61642.1 hypothetical protein SAMN06295910_0634 [Allosphingosinicella indica]
MSLEKQKDGRGGHGAKSDSGKSKKSGGKADVGNALRTVYQRTVNEDIPPEMLDLLGKLG